MMVTLALFMMSVICSAGTNDEHKQELMDISKKAEKYETYFQELQERKMQAREGEELESVLNDIRKIHKNILDLRRSRIALREHLAAEHPDSPLIYEKTLYKSFDKNKRERLPIDDKLDELLKLMQSQYGKYIANTPQEVAEQQKHEAAVVPAGGTTKPAVNPAVVKKTPPALNDEENKNRYLREQVKTEIKVKALTEEEKKKLKEAAEAAAAAHKAEEPKKPSGGH